MYLHFNAISMNASRNWTAHNSKASKALERISSGKRINRAADDPAGLAVSEKIKLQLTLLNTDKMNVENGMSQIQISDGALDQMSSMLSRMQELADMAASGIYSGTDRYNMNAEYQQLLEAVNGGGQGTAGDSYKLFRNNPLKALEGQGAYADLSGSFSFQGNNLEAYLNGLDKLLRDIALAAVNEDDKALLALGIDRNNGLGDSVNIHSAIIRFTKENANRLLNTQAENGGSHGRNFTISISGGDITINMPDINKKSLGLDGTNLLTQADAKKAMEAVKNATNRVSSWRGDMGAAYNRLEYTMNSIYTLEENLTNALSRICDADIAKEMMIFVKEQVLAQASAFVMAQANQEPQQVISLLKSLG